jgi:hypothetical protein
MIFGCHLAEVAQRAVANNTRSRCKLSPQRGAGNGPAGGVEINGRRPRVRHVC